MRGFVAARFPSIELGIARFRIPKEVESFAGINIRVDHNLALGCTDGVIGQANFGGAIGRCGGIPAQKLRITRFGIPKKVISDLLAVFRANVGVNQNRRFLSHAPQRQSEEQIEQVGFHKNWIFELLGFGLAEQVDNEV